MGLLSYVDPIDAVKRKVLGAIGIGALIAIVGLSAYGARNHQLLVQRNAQLGTIRIVLADIGMKPKVGGEADAVKVVVSQRGQYLAERDQARTLVEAQSASIDRLNGEEQAAQREAAAAQKLLVQTIKQRDEWIAKAKAASTRTERESAEREAAECESVLDSLYASYF
jgi:hypothetical protein